MNRPTRLSLLFALGLILAACGEERQGMVATANRHASAAAAEIIEAGGSAADAVIAAQLVLGLVEPQSSGIGGGAFALHWDEADEALTAWDGRETAPAAAGPHLLPGAGASAEAFHAAATGGRAVGVPGIVSLLRELHQAEGSLAWEDLFTPALRLAEDGFPVSERLHGAIAEADGLGDAMDTAFSGSSGMEPRFEFELKELQARKLTEIGSLRVTPFAVNHGPVAGACFAYRIEAEGRTIAYSGDTEWTDELIEAGREADLFIAEAYFREKPVKLHLDLAVLERHLELIRPKRLVLTHMSDEMLARRGEVVFETAHDGMVVRL